MSHEKLRTHKTDLDNLVANLRGEVGEIIFAWMLLRDFLAAAIAAQSSDIQKDMQDPQLAVLNALTDKLSDEIVGRLSELAERKIGRLNFYFASVKLKALDKDVEAFERFIKTNRFHEKRNYDVAHKELPEQWNQHKYIHIDYRIVRRGVVMALRLTKKIDRIVLGPSSRFLWREMRKRRYPPGYPAKVRYMLLPYLALSGEDRARIVVEEMAEGMNVWEDMETTFNGRPACLKACKKWAVVALENQLLALDNYPLQKLTSIETGPPQGGAGSQEERSQEDKDL